MKVSAKPSNVNSHLGQDLEISYLQETFIFDLSITEQESDWLVSQPSFQHTTFNIFLPFYYTVILRQLDLKRLIIAPVMNRGSRVRLPDRVH